MPPALGGDHGIRRSVPGGGDLRFLLAYGVPQVAGGPWPSVMEPYASGLRNDLLVASTPACRVAAALHPPPQTPPLATTPELAAQMPSRDRWDLDLPQGTAGSGGGQRPGRWHWEASGISRWEPTWPFGKMRRLP